MPSFTVMVREHAYTGQFYGEVVQAESYEKALRVAAEHAGTPQPPGPEPQQKPETTATAQAQSGPPADAAAPAGRREEPPPPTAAPRPPTGPEPRRGFNVTVTAQAQAGPVYSDVVLAASSAEALHIAAAKAAAPQPPPAPEAWSAAADRPRCADVWVYSLLHCQLAAGHDPPHIAVAPGYLRAVRWVRDARGIAHAVPEPPAGPPVAPSTMQAPPAPEEEAEPSGPETD
jgi:hypothetical protein